ncbi:cytochrome C oxidase subunit IV family protein [Gordonia sp. (in: high G+C Gram-positive bacteria)]|jgi:heme/copper-type cytochrome/quinol oxidase subunit 4|uniref:cytochrome C oxidase subunit IV family protein n=1 Tax=Gordonia sp. (in: high G+C Gram-positive bacteria) TaxID=84139 RepID=UPI001DA260E7|nr:cytochrome C oxidase subunit IV family protein [Gordonia sp. (in: high G+C Gram-positive bacteria)]MCB1296379.1 cytochrome C oxidase subunit IV family protein [Gordonia sp. (in: high G+C Gram-positive bacteria)]HMS77403.1 cytochrome C oxidase subunit IV family protein [Gordonia sp. (in: high G+C Gram-positive bacteria)]HQV17763.1 cytochrome C oxidase subunit IV family protein [Gordonia sp. (in: high G+C Gram-positive bacteria)]
MTQTAQNTSVQSLFRNRPIVVTWGLLLAATVLTTWILTMDSIDYRWAMIAMLAVAAWKIRLVMTDFMELRDAPLAGRLVFEGWAVALPVVLAVLLWH